MAAIEQPSNDESTNPVTDLTGFKRDVLGVLAGTDGKYGLAIKRELEDAYGSAVNHGRLYPNLDDLVEMDLVEKSARDRRTNDYVLTEAGIETLAQYHTWMGNQLEVDR